MSDASSRFSSHLNRWRLGRSAQTAFDPAGRIVRNVAAEAQKSQLPQMAAALAYRTIFGLLPMLVVGLVAIKVFASPERVQQTVRDLVNYIGLSNISLEGVRGASGGTDAAASSTTAPDGFVGPPGLVASSQGIDDWLVDLLTRANQTVSFDAIGWVALLAFLYAAISMMVEIERAFNQIYKVPSGRSWARRLTQYWTLLTLGGVGLFATFYLQQQFETHAINTVSWVAEAVTGERPVADSPGSTRTRPPAPPPPEPAPEPETGPSAMVDAVAVVDAAAEKVGDTLTDTAKALEKARDDPPAAPWWLDAIKFSTTAAISTGILMLAYTVVPNTRVRFGPAFAGALTGAVLFEAGKQGFAQYVEYSATYAKLYGSLALIPLFMLWVYVTWIIVLSGLQVAYYLQYGREKKLAQPIVDAGPGLVEPAAAVLVMSAIARDFQAGKTDDAPSVARATRLSEPVVSLVLSRMAERGLLHRVNADGTDRQRTAYTLARPPAAIFLREVLAIGFEIAGAAAEGAGGDLPVNPMLERMRQAQLDAAANQTLADIVGLDSEPGSSAAEVVSELSPSLTRRAEAPSANGHAQATIPASLVGPDDPPRPGPTRSP